MKRGALGIMAIVAAATAVAAMFACTGADPDLQPTGGDGDAGGGGDTGTSTPPDSATTGDAGATDTGGGGSDATRVFGCNQQPCAGDDVVCCKANDLDGAACVARSSCFHEFAKIECNDRADCPAGQFCCSRTYTPTPDSGPPFYLGAHCQADGCGESFVCQTAADCPDAMPSCSATTTADYIPTMTFCQ